MNETYIAAARSAAAAAVPEQPFREHVTPPVHRFIFVDRQNFSDARLYAELHQAYGLPPTVPDYQDAHAHDADQFYFFIGNQLDMGGLEGQIKLEGAAHRITSPAAVYVPANTVHEYKVTGGEGHVVILLRSPVPGCTRKNPDLKKGSAAAETYSRYILRSDVRPTSELKFHHDTAPGERHVMVDAKKLAEAQFYTIVRNAYNVQASQADYVDQHRHNCDTYHLFIGNEDDLTGLQAEMVFEGRKSIVDSPAAVYVPEGVPHCYRLIGGSGKFFNIVPRGVYNESLI